MLLYANVINGGRGLKQDRPESLATTFLSFSKFFHWHIHRYTVCKRNGHERYTSHLTWLAGL